MRRGLVTKNRRWRGGMMTRWLNLLLGKGFRTNAEYLNDLEKKSKAESRAFRATLGPSRKSRPSSPDQPLMIVECISCGKWFKRCDLNTNIRSHKDALGFPCPGRHGTVGS